MSLFKMEDGKNLNLGHNPYNLQKKIWAHLFCDYLVNDLLFVVKLLTEPQGLQKIIGIALKIMWILGVEGPFDGKRLNFEKSHGESRLGRFPKRPLLSRWLGI